MLLIKSQVQRATDDSADVWRIGNAAIYTLCREYPFHTDPSAVIAKIWIIGRTYAAAIERRKPQTDTTLVGDLFYTEKVAPAMISSDLDRLLAFLPQDGDPDQLAEDTLEVHAYLLYLFHKLTKLKKRSLASKYLHFHRPGLFFIYDERATRAMRRLKPLTGYTAPAPARGVDPEYHRFVHAALALRRRVHDDWGLSLTPRQLDRALLAIADDRSKPA